MTRRAAIALMTCASALAMSCSGGQSSRPPVPTVPPTQATSASPEAPAAQPSSVEVTLIDEDGQPVPAATLALIGRNAEVQLSAVTEVEVEQPVAGVIEASGYLSEVVVLEPSRPQTTVTMLATTSPSGIPRSVLHFGGDVMMARRFQEPTELTDTPLVSDDASAVGVVADIAALMAAADATIVNLETVIGALPKRDGAKGRGAVLQSPPSVVTALQTMGVDVATRANERANDFGDGGLSATSTALDAANIAHTGAALPDPAPPPGVIVDAGGVSVGVIARSTISGDLANDALAPVAAEKPEGLPTSAAWEYELVTFGHGNIGDANYVPIAARRPIEIWETFTALEPKLDPADAAELWSAITAPDKFPRLQDYIARRGHGGSVLFDPNTIDDDIDALRAGGAQVVVVSLHGGTQNSDAPTPFLRDAARRAVDAGADLIVGHHPHVAQGFEWHSGKLIAYSLGNLVYDQLAAANTSSLMLRVIFEGPTMLQATVVPLTVERYRPLALAGDAARSVLQLLDERSAVRMSTRRDVDGYPALVPDPSVTGAATVVPGGSIGVISDSRTVVERSAVSNGDGVIEVPDCAVARIDSPDIEFGVEVLDWGAFDNATADGSSEGPLHWNRSGVVAMGEASDGEDPYVSLIAEQASGAFIRPSGRVALPRHRRIADDDTPLDSRAEYTLSLSTRRIGGETPSVRLAVYPDAGEDNPDEPAQVLIESELTLTGTLRDWTESSFEVTPQLTNEVNGERPSGMLVYVDNPPGPGELDVDDVRLIEWRSHSRELLGEWAPLDAVRTAPNTTVRLVLSGCDTAG
jgi:poly-gamma-glutamate capsule biosynthesis protein CapA/YwtB (metallophosphatase superfamily)